MAAAVHNNSFDFFRTTSDYNYDLSEIFSTTDSVPSSRTGTSGVRYGRVFPEWDIDTARVMSIISISGLSIVIILCFVSFFVTKDCWSRFKRQQLGFTAGRTLLILFILALILNLCSSILSIHYQYNDELPQFQKLRESIEARILYDFGKWCLSMFFILRLHFIFNRTPALRVNRWILGVLIVMISLTLCWTSITSMGWLLEWWNSDDLPGTHKERSAITNSIIVTVDIVVTIYFFQRLMSVVIMQAKVQNDAESTLQCESTVNSQSVQSTTSEGIRVTVDEKLMNTVTKSTFLNLVGVLSTFALIGYLSYLSAEDISNPFVLGSLRLLDGMINTFCMFLVFGFAAPFYNGSCKWCHLRMRRCCARTTERVLNANANGNNDDSVTNPGSDMEMLL